MKAAKALLILTLMSASVTAMAEGGGDKVAERMQHAREVAMARYQKSEQGQQQQAVAASKAGNPEVERSN